jgi:hypothetical protein
MTTKMPKLMGTQEMVARIRVHSLDEADDFLEAFAPGARKKGTVQILRATRTKGVDSYLLTIKFTHTAQNMTQTVDGYPSGNGDGDYNTRRFIQEASDRSKIDPMKVEIELGRWVRA